VHNIVSGRVFLAVLAMAAAPASAAYVNGPLSGFNGSGTDTLETGPNADISFVTMNDQSVFDHNGGNVSFAYLRNQSRETVKATQSWLYSYDQSTVVIGTGADLTWLIMADDSAATMNGGSLVIAEIGGNSRVLFDFANAGSLSSLRFNDIGGRVTVRGYNLVASSSAVDGRRADGTVFSMSMSFSPCAWGVGCDPVAIDPENFAGLLLDNLGTLPVPDAVPDASTWALLVLGFGAVGGQIRRRRKGLLAA
jgi:hypothetical protein